MNVLANYVASEFNSKGRNYSEPSPGLRSEYQRDRDRIIHSSAFRRLEYKTQVFVNHEGDMFRTRLIHSLEVAQIGRTVARALSLNEDLTEAICLAHDLGHTPFGHAGQDALNKCMKDFGGFEHNLQSLRVVDILEEKYPDFPGLNLTFESREGILKHCSLSNAKSLGDLGLRFLNRQQPSLEAQIANIADEIAYNNHDIDDGLRAGLLNIDMLCSCTLFSEQYKIVKKLWPQLDTKKTTSELIRRMINCVVVDLVENSKTNITAIGLSGIEQVRLAGSSLISLSGEMKQHHKELKGFLRKNLYSHERVEEMSIMAKDTVRDLFNRFMDDEQKLPDEVHLRINRIVEDDGTKRARIIADYIAGMTDRFALLSVGRS